MKATSGIILSIASLLLASTAILADAVESTTDPEANEIAVEAYQYLYPLILMDVTRRALTAMPAGIRDGMGPMNQFHHARAFPTADSREVIRPNFDTLYSNAWLDLSREPMIVSMPDTQDRYYQLQMLDMWTDTFAAPGKRTSGTGARDVAITGPNWNGVLPDKVERINSPTSYVWIIGRTQTDGIDDYSNVHAVQEGYKITPLSRWSEPRLPFRPAVPRRAIPAPPETGGADPVDLVNAMPAPQYFSYAAELMKLNPPHATDWSSVARFKRIGIVPGEGFAFEHAPPEVQDALTAATDTGLEQMKARSQSLARIVNGWQLNTDTMGVYGNYYLKRAIVAMVGVGANEPQDAIYPMNVHDADKIPMDGANRYVMHFAKEDLPPVDAFWSITMYDEDGYQVANAINRFAIGDRDDMQYNDDGSLDIYMQHEPPAGKESNWLPSPAKGALGVTMRLYVPRAEALDSGPDGWKPSWVQKAE